MANDVLFNGTVNDVFVRIIETDATEMTTKEGYTLEEWDEPTAKLIIDDSRYVVPIFGAIPTKVTEEMVALMLKDIL